MSRALVAPACVSADAERRALQMMKLDHLGEYIAVNIYSAQIRVCRYTAPDLQPLLSEFLAHEQNHLRIFAAELAARSASRSRGFHLLGVLGFLLGVFSALLGRAGVAACTAAVETVVLAHLEEQRAQLHEFGDTAALAAIEAILRDEQEHQTRGVAMGQGSLAYRCVYALVAPATATIIALGLHL